MCISEATIDLMLDLPTQVAANAYSLLMRNNTPENDVISLADRSASELTTSHPAPVHSHIENTVIAA